MSARHRHLWLIALVLYAAIGLADMGWRLDELWRAGEPVADRRDRRFAQRALRIVQVEVQRLQQRADFFLVRVQQHIEIEAGAEAARQRAGQDHGPHSLVSRGAFERSDHGTDHLERECIDRRGDGGLTRGVGR